MQIFYMIRASDLLAKQQYFEDIQSRVKCRDSNPTVNRGQTQARMRERKTIDPASPVRDFQVEYHSLCS